MYADKIAIKIGLEFGIQTHTILNTKTRKVEDCESGRKTDLFDKGAFGRENAI